MKLNPRTLIKTLLFIAALPISTWANAHTGVDGAHSASFMTGLLHPFFGLDHLAAMVAVGVWSGLVAKQAGREMLWGPLGFANMLLAGALIGLQGIALPAVEPVIAASLLVIGLLVVAKLHLPGAAAALLVGAFAVFHGVAHGLELAHSSSAFQALAGMLCATVTLHLCGLAVGWSLRGVNVWVGRLVGSGVALFGGLLLANLAFN
jgi:urease accessory protein